MYYIIKLYYFVAVLSLTYTPILPTYFKNKKTLPNKNVKKRKKRDQNKKRKKSFYVYGLKLLIYAYYSSNRPNCRFLL